MVPERKDFPWLVLERTVLPVTVVVPALAVLPVAVLEAPVPTQRLPPRWKSLY